jgi:hypothetical protein
MTAMIPRLDHGGPGPPEPGPVRITRRSCLCPLMERRLVAQGQDRLNDAGSEPAALLAGAGAVMCGSGALALAVAVATGDLLGASGPF